MTQINIVRNNIVKESPRLKEKLYVRLLRVSEEHSESLQLRAIKETNASTEVFRMIKEPTKDVQRIAIEMNQVNIIYCDTDVQKEYLKMIPFLITYFFIASNELLLTCLEAQWSRSFYERFIEKYPRDKEFQREFNRLKLIKGPLV